jgi:hypothetical protein
MYFSPNIILVIKSRRMRWAGHVARMGEKGICWEISTERNLMGDTGVDRKIMIIWNFRKWDLGGWVKSSLLRIWRGGGLL